MRAEIGLADWGESKSGQILAPETSRSGAPFARENSSVRAGGPGQGVSVSFQQVQSANWARTAIQRHPSVEQQLTVALPLRRPIGLRSVKQHLTASSPGFERISMSKLQFSSA